MTEKDPVAALIDGLCKVTEASAPPRPPLLSTPAKVKRSVLFRKASAEKALHAGREPGFRGRIGIQCHVCGSRGPKRFDNGRGYCRNCGSLTGRHFLIRENRRKAIQEALRERGQSGKVRTADPHLSSQPEAPALESGPIEQVVFNIDLGI